MSDHHDEHDDHWDPGLVNRRFALQMLGGVAGIVGLGRCSGGGASVTPTRATATPTAAASGAATATASASATATAMSGTQACAQSPEGEIGPYFTDDSASGYNRSNILSNIDGSSTQTGVPFTLTVFVYDTEKACAPYVGAQVDIWHCNASGIYSNESSENTSGITWLRGYQITDSTGKVTFTTIIPGWYQGRTTHIHLRVRSTYSEASSTSDGTNTTQVFFPQALVDNLSTNVSPYKSEGVNNTTNASDRVYADQTQGKNLLSPVGDTTNGYTASFSIGLPIG